MVCDKVEIAVLVYCSVKSKRGQQKMALGDGRRRQRVDTGQQVEEMGGLTVE
jgi:hypothetical protein